MDLRRLFLSCAILGYTMVIQVSGQNQVGYCTKMIVSTITQMVQVSTTRTITSYYKCKWWWTCTRYRTAIAYRTETRERQQYASTIDCCPGFHSEGAGGCVADNVRVRPPTTLSSPTGNGTSYNHSVSTPSGPDVRNVSNVTPVTTTLPDITDVTTSSRTNQTSPENSGLASMPHAGPIIMVVLLSLLAVVVIALVVGCLVHRRRKQRNRSDKIDSLNMEPLGERQLLSKPGIRHFRPSFAPDDDYAIVDKRKNDGESTGKKTDGPALHNYENSMTFEGKYDDETKPSEKRTSLVSLIAKKMRRQKSKNLTHTYMEGPMSKDEVLDTAEQQTSRDNAERDSVYTNMDSEMDTLITKESRRRGGETPAGDLSKPSESEEVVAPYDTIQSESKGSKSEAVQNGTDVYEIMSGDVPSHGSTGKTLPPQQSKDSSEQAGAYDNLDRGLSFTSEQGQELLDQLHGALDATGYGQIEGCEQDHVTGAANHQNLAKPDGQKSQISEPLYLNHDAALQEALREESDNSKSASKVEMASLPHTTNKETLAAVDGATNHGDTSNYSLMVDSKTEAYDTFERRLDGGTLSTQPGAGNRGQENAALLYENL